MGIDPLTHKPLPPSTTTNHAYNKQEMDSSINNNSTSKCQIEPKYINKEANKIVALDQGADFVSSNNFCIDEIPVIEPYEILQVCNDNSSSTHSPSSSVMEELHSFDDYFGIMANDPWCEDFNGLDLLLKNGNNSEYMNWNENIMPTIEEHWEFWGLAILLCKIGLSSANFSYTLGEYKGI